MFAKDFINMPALTSLSGRKSIYLFASVFLDSGQVRLCGVQMIRKDCNSLGSFVISRTRLIPCVSLERRRLHDFLTRWLHILCMSCWTLVNPGQGAGRWTEEISRVMRFCLRQNAFCGASFATQETTLDWHAPCKARLRPKLSSFTRSREELHWVG